MAGDVEGGFKQAEGVHHVFSVVALSVCLRALVARFVAFRQPLLIGGVFAAVAAVSVLVEGEVGSGVSPSGTELRERLVAAGLGAMPW